MIRIAQIAHHESGHAVSAAVLGVRFEYACIEENREKNTLGHTTFARAVESDGGGDQWSDIIEEIARDRDTRNRIVCALAGRRAEERYIGAAVDSGFAGDYRIVLCLFRRMGVPNTGGRLYHRYDMEARRLVVAHWPEITSVATALVNRERLTAAEIQGIIRQGNSCREGREWLSVQGNDRAG